jgi:hypothetical protein
MTHDLLKYPRTRHIEGSRLQAGDEDLESVPFSAIAERQIVVEEKVDGANCGVSFDAGGDFRLQSRGHYLTGGYRERHFGLFKQWANTHRAALREVLGARFIAYGEWLYAKHTVFYDQLPHYFLEFDVYDREAGAFLSTERRQAMWRNTPVASVPVLQTGRVTTLAELTRLVGPSLFKSTEWRRRLEEVASAAGLDPALVSGQTDDSDDAEGLYIKVEEDGVVAERFKWVRASFLSAVADSGGHWLDRPIVPNQLAEHADLFRP